MHALKGSSQVAIVEVYVPARGLVIEVPEQTLGQLGVTELALEGSAHVMASTMKQAPSSDARASSRVIQPLRQPLLRDRDGRVAVHIEPDLVETGLQRCFASLLELLSVRWDQRHDMRHILLAARHPAQPGPRRVERDDREEEFVDPKPVSEDQVERERNVGCILARRASEIPAGLASLLSPTLDLGLGVNAHCLPRLIQPEFGPIDGAKTSGAPMGGCSPEDWSQGANHIAIYGRVGRQICLRVRPSRPPVPAVTPSLHGVRYSDLVDLGEANASPDQIHQPFQPHFERRRLSVPPWLPIFEILALLEPPPSRGLVEGEAGPVGEEAKGYLFPDAALDLLGLVLRFDAS